MNRGEFFSRLSAVTLKAGFFSLGRCRPAEKLTDSISGKGGVILGTGISNVQDLLPSWKAHQEGPSQGTFFHRMVVPMIMPNASAGCLSRQFKLSDCCTTLSASCASEQLLLEQPRSGFGQEKTP